MVDPGTTGFAVAGVSSVRHSAEFSDISDSRLSETSEIFDANDVRSVRLPIETDRNAYETDKPLCRGASAMVEFGTGGPPSDISPCACKV
jgi:hypothetical protein